MTADEFRRLALALPEAVESAHQGHPDFRVRGKIFATLGPDEEWGMVKLTLETQAACVSAHPSAFEAFDNAWGRRGATRVVLARARKPAVRAALLAAWRGVAPKRLVDGFGEADG